MNIQPREPEHRPRCPARCHDGDMYTGMAPTKGRLLVATPTLDDPHFHHSVVFMVEHHADGALGLVLNRPSAESLDVPLDAWVRVQSAPPRVFSGGPVEPDALIALARTDGPVEEDDDGHLAPLTASIASADLAADPDEVAPNIRALRVFRGYAGWSLVLDSDESDVFTAEPDELWRTVLRRQPGRLGWLAGAPDDLGWN